MTLSIQKRIVRRFLKQEYAPVEESVLTDIHMSVNTDLRENAGESKTCVYQHKALDTANENFYDDEEDSESEKIQNLRRLTSMLKIKGVPAKMCLLETYFWKLLIFLAFNLPK